MKKIVCMECLTVVDEENIITENKIGEDIIYFSPDTIPATQIRTKWKSERVTCPNCGKLVEIIKAKDNNFYMRRLSTWDVFKIFVDKKIKRKLASLKMKQGFSGYFCSNFYKENEITIYMDKHFKPCDKKNAKEYAFFDIDKIKEIVLHCFDMSVWVDFIEEFFIPEFFDYYKEYAKPNLSLEKLPETSCLDIFCEMFGVSKEDLFVMAFIYKHDSENWNDIKWRKCK